MAAKQLVLSAQMPSKPTYMTDGPTRTRTVGYQVIQFRHASSKTIVGAGHKTGAVFHALRNIGKDRIDDQVINTLVRALEDEHWVQLSKQSKHVRAWMLPVVQKIVAHA